MKGWRVEGWRWRGGLEGEEMKGGEGWTVMVVVGNITSLTLLQA